MNTGSEKSRILFICRGSAKDGLGHVIRSKQIASILNKTCLVKMIVLGDESAEGLLFNQGIDFTITKHDTHVMNHFHQFKPTVVVFDLIFFEENLFTVVKSKCPTVSLSPIFNCLDQVSLVFHRTSILGSGWQPRDGGPIYHCGLQYAIISSHCSKISTTAYKRNLQHETLAVAVSMGGGDAANKTLTLLNKLKDMPDRYLFWVLLGEGYVHSYEDLVKCIKGSRHEIILAKTTDSMWRILEMCSMVILAGGTTTYEAAFSRLPSINILEDETHYFLVQELVEKGVAVSAGYTFEESLAALRGKITLLNRNREELLLMHERSLDLIDGKGSERVTESILRLQPEGYTAVIKNTE